MHPICIRILKTFSRAARAYRRAEGRGGADRTDAEQTDADQTDADQTDDRGGRVPGQACDPVTARSREVPSLSPYHAADARHDPRPATRATDPRRRRRRQDRPPRAHLPRARGLHGRRGRRRPGRARCHRDAPPGAGRARPDAPRAGRAGRHPCGPPRRRGGHDADHHPLGAGLHHRPHRRPRGRRRRLPAQALLPRRAGPPREVAPAPRGPGRPGRHDPAAAPARRPAARPRPLRGHPRRPSRSR